MPVELAPASAAEEPNLADAFDEIDAGAEITPDEAGGAPPEGGSPPPGEPGGGGSPPQGQAGQTDQAGKPGEGTPPGEAKPGEAGREQQQQQFDIEKTPEGFRKYFKGKLNEAQSEVARLTKELEAAKGGEATDALTKTLAQRDQELATLRSELASARFETSADFKKNFEKPFQNAWRRAATSMEALEVITKADEDGKAQETRPATAKDLEYLFGQRSRGDAIRLAHEMFGANAPRVEAALHQLYERSDDMADALNEERENWKANNDERTANRQQVEQATAGMWVKVNQDLVAKKADVFADNPDDPEGNKLHQQGRQLMDTYFRKRATMNPQDRVLMDANVYQRAAAHGMLLRRLRIAEAKLAKLTASGEHQEQQIPGVKHGKPTEIPKPQGKTFGEDVDDSFFTSQDA